MGPATLVAAVAGALTGESVRRSVVRGGHRLAEEQHLPRRRAWLLVPAAALCWAWLALGWWPARPYLLGAMLLVSVPLLWLAAVDVDVERLPDRVTLPLLPVTAGLVLVVGLLERDPAAAGRGLLGGLALGLFYLLLALVGRGGMGGGDVKLAPTLGMLLGYLSWIHVTLAVLATFLGATVFAIGLVLVRGAGMRSLFAFGPHMVAATLLVLGLPA